MFSPFVYVFSILLVEIRQSVVLYLADKRVRVSRTFVEKFICQTVNKLMNGFEVKSGM